MFGNPPPPPPPPPLRAVQRYAPQALMHALEGQSLNAAREMCVLNGGERSMYAAIEDLAKEEVIFDTFLGVHLIRRIQYVSFKSIYVFL